jgi:RimJ/RimL family protein N-acetyltransferase
MHLFYRKDRHGSDGPVIRPVENDVEAQEARSLLTEQIKHPSPVPFPERLIEDDHQLRATLIGAWADERLVAAAFIGPDIQDSQLAGAVAGDHAREFFIENVAMIHGIAVDIDHRHEGIGSKIKRFLTPWAADHHTCLVLSIATTDFARAMNEKTGYIVLPPQVPLVIKVIDHVTGKRFAIAFPFSPDQRRDGSWAYGIITQPAGIAFQVGEYDPAAAPQSAHDDRNPIE